ncbi:MAG: hypothetical protein JSV92_04625 [archaeon]|nr:MAG: hypothetical protein JSV92_04625 [archaeon]
MKKEFYFIGAIFILVLAAAFLFFYYSPSADYPIEYGIVECVDGKPAMGFYNPNKVELKNISISVPTDSGLDVYEVTDPLEPAKTEVLILNHSTCVLDQGEIRLRWCSEACFSVKMETPSRDISIKIIG